MANSKNNSFYVQGTVLAAASIIGRIIGLLYRFPLTKIIGEEGMGAYSNAYEIYNIALLLSTYSIPTAISKLVSARESKRQYRNSYHVFLLGMCFSVIVGGIFTIVLLFSAESLSVRIFKSADSSIPLKVLAPTIFIFSVMGVIRGFFQGKSAMLPTAVSQILEQIVNAFVSIAAAVLLMSNYSASANICAYGAAGGTLGTFCGALAALLFLLFIYSIYRPILKKRLRRDRSGRTEPLSLLFKLLLLTIVPIILNQTVYSVSSLLDSHLMNTIFDAKGIGEAERLVLWGRYSGKYRLLTNVPIAIASAIGVAIIPNVVQVFTGGEKERLDRKIGQAIKFNMLIAIPCAVGMGVLARPIMQLMFPGTEESIAMSSNMLRLGAVSIVFFAYSTTTNSILQAVNRMRLPVFHGVVSLAGYLLLDFVLLSYTPVGVYGLVIGNTVFPLIICILNWISLKREVGFRQELDRTFFRVGLSAAIMGAAAAAAYYGLYTLCKNNTVSVAAAIGLAVLVYAVALLVFKAVDGEELYELPKGRFLAAFAKKLHLL